MKAPALVTLAALGALVEPAPGQPAGGRDFSRQTARAAPGWARDAVVYEIFPRDFSAEGDLAGVTASLDRLRDLGVTVIWLMPIHPIGEARRKGTFGSPYSIRDYYAVNPDYGTVDDLRRLVREAHARGLRVILDVVANHTSWDSVMMRTPELYVRDAAGRVQPPNADWSDVAKLDYANPKTRAYMTAMMAHWLREAEVDGFRCDVAGLVPTDFWEQARSALEAVRPDLFLLAEWSSPDLLPKAFDADYAWPFHAALTRVLSLGAPASELRAAWEEERRVFPQGSLHLRFSDNHDEKRAIARFGEPAALAAQALVFTLDGIPLVYNGMEVGDTTESGGAALSEKLPVFWAIAERRPEFPRFYREMIALRRAHAALRRGATRWLDNAAADRLVSFLRSDGEEEILVAVNLSSRPLEATLRLAHGTAFSEITPAIPHPVQPGGAVPPRELRPVELPSIALDAWGFRIFRRKGSGLGL
ncbi:MAG TPA: alpha-amylase family glycosyl hydrolase [Vicinamibacteria bacterium]|nr:alpha-amylase family glycosyl hydrolase [Vicinamibacteria bacterium]